MGIGAPTFQYANNVNITAIQSFGNCPNGTCSSNLGGLGTFQTVMAFGDFFWGFAQTVLFIPAVIVLPAFFITNDLYCPLSLNGCTAFAGIYNVALWFLYGAFTYTLVTGRYNLEID